VVSASAVERVRNNYKSDLPGSTTEAAKSPSNEVRTDGAAEAHCVDRNKPIIRFGCAAEFILSLSKGFATEASMRHV